MEKRLDHMMEVAKISCAIRNSGIKTQLALLEGEVLTYEALARHQHSQHGEVPEGKMLERRQMALTMLKAFEDSVLEAAQVIRARRVMGDN